MTDEKLIEGVPELLKLHLACGQEKRPGYVNVDISKAVEPDVVLDLLSSQWPWEPDSVSEIVVEHFIEHIPMLCACCPPQTDPLIAFFNRCFDVLKPGGIMKVVVPAASSDRAFQDPTHRRFIPRQFFAYLEAPWRKAQKLDHMDFACDFENTVSPMIDAAWASRTHETQWFGMEHYRNVCWDFNVALRAVKPMRTGV